MNELLEPRSTEKPSWLELPEEEKQRHIYWSCKGLGTGATAKKEDAAVGHPSGRWISCYHSKEEAEASASRNNASWKWDKQPAVPVTLPDIMFAARASDIKGVLVIGYKNSQWTVLKTYPASVPLSPLE